MAKSLVELYGTSQRNQQNTQVVKKETEKPNFFTRGLHTIGDIAANILTGAAKGLEGIYDFGASIVGAVGGIFSDDFQDDVQKHIAYDWTSENIGNPLQELTKYSYTNDSEFGRMVEGVASGVGQMLPMVAVSAIPGAGQVAANAVLFSSAAGNQTESAYNDGASYYGGLGYGLASGAVETATERLMGGATKNIFGRGILDGVGKSIADTGLKRVAKNALSEGAEEVLAEVANPALKAIYKGKNAFSEYKDGEYWKGVGEAGAIGSLTALAYGGTVGYGMSKIKTKNGQRLNYVGAEADINDSLQEIEGQKKKANNLFTDDKLSDENAARISQNIQGNYQNIEKTLQKAKPEKRAKLIKEFSLESAFESDGTMKADFASTLDFTKQAEAITENGVNGSENAVASLDRRYINPDLIGQDTKVNKTLAAATEKLRQDFMEQNNATYEQAVEAVKDITPFKEEFTDKGKASYSKFKKGLNYLNSISGHTVNMVVVDEHDSFNGSISDDTIYIGADTFENDTWAGTLVHEYTHFAEGSKEYAKLVQYLREDVSLFEKAFGSVFNKGYVSQQEMEQILDKAQNKESLTKEEAKVLSLFESEVGAHLTENLLGNENFIDRLVGKETKLAEKVLNKIADLKKMFERIGNAEARVEYKRIKKAEKLYLGAVEKAGYAYINRKIVASRRREEVDASEEIQYNRKYFKFLHKNFPTEKESGSEAHRLAVWWARRPDVQTGDQTLISMNDRWYLVERFDDADNNYQVEEFITKAEFEKIYKEIKEYGRSGKIKSIQERFVGYDKLNKSSYSLKARKSSIDSNETQYGREDTKVVRMDSGEIERGERIASNGDGDSSSGSADRQGQPVNFSLKDSNGNSLTEEQAKFFVDSKIRDEQGNLRVMYHGTAKNFNTFLRSKMGKNGLNLGEGFYFTPNKDQAEGYAEGKSPRIMEVYLNVKNPLSRENSLSKNEEAMAWIYKTIGEYHSTEFIDGMTEGLVGSIELIKEYTEKTGEGVDEILKRFGYDGIDAVNTFVVFDSNQVKYTTNQKPSQRSDMRYSLKNSEGETLTAEQAEYFAKSKIRDSKGNLLVVYHGSPKAGFTVFRTELEGAYFTADKNYALDYARANNENIYSVYLNIEKPFDTRDPKAKKIFEEQFFGKWGNGAPLTDRGLLDWTDGADMYDFIQENGLDYDGIIIDEGGVPTANGVRDRGISYVAFYPEQIKNTSNKTPTADKDIRFSLKRNQIRAIEARGVKGDSLLNAIDLAEEILAVNGEITDDGKAIVYHATSLENAHKIIESGKMFGKEDNLFFSTKADGEILGYGDSIVEAQIPLEKLQLNDVFAEEVHLTMSVKPNTLTNIRFSLKDKYFYRLTDGQVKKALANYTKFKVYSKVDAESIINNVLGNYMSFGESYGVISGKTKNEVIEMLWRGLNTAEPGRQAKVALDIAEYILQNAVLENIYEDDSNQVYIDTIQVLKPYLHSINLNGIKGDIKHKYDRDNSPYLLWGKRKEHGGRGADVIAMELEEQGFYIDGINEADIFFQIDTAYREAVAALKKQAKELLDSSLSKEERYELKQQIAKEVLRGFDYQGKPSKLADIAKTYSDKAKFWKDKYYDERKRNTVINRLLDSVQKIKDIKLGTFLNATQFKSEIFKGSIEKLSSIKYRGDLNKSGTRKIVAGLQEWYSEKNPMLEGVFDEEIASILEDIATGEGDLSTTELQALSNVVDYFKHFIETYNKVYRNGKYVDAEPIAKRYVDNIHANQKAKVGWLRKYFEKYITTFADPMTVARYMDRYSNGFYSEQLESLRKGAVGAGVMEMEMREPLEEFYKKHKKFLKSLNDKTVTYQGTEIPLSQAMLLYMSLNRNQAILGLAKSGFAYADKDGKITRLNGFAVEEGLEIDEIKAKAQEVQKALASQFTETEMEYISIAEKLFNEDCKEAKRKTDMDLRGYTNALDDYYVPIRRYVVGKSVDTETYLDEMARVSNASFNKDTVKGAKNELFLGTLEGVLDRHIRAVSLYANLAMPLREYDVLYNLDTAGNLNKPISVKTEGVKAWTNGEKYFQKLVKDIQGIPASDSIINKTLSQLRGGYAKYQLGANPKVWVTQLSSFGAAGSILDIGSIVKGFGIAASDVDDYCALAKLRNNENSAALAQGVLEKTGKIGDVLMKPIGWVDRLVVKKLFGACQVQVEKNGGAKAGTKENKLAAGKLLEKVILETQQNAIATERSAAMRDGNDIMKTLTMFSADSMKVIGRVIDSIGEVAVLKAKQKNATDPAEIASLDKKIKAATKKAGRSIASLVSTAAFMALVAQLFRTLYNKDDEDENIVENMKVDAVGNLLGGLPLFRDIYSFYAEGYDLDNYAYSTVNDLLQSGQDVFDVVGSIFEGSTDSRDVAASVKKAAYAGGQLLGIPTRNIYNFVYGLTKRFSPSMAYKIDDMFYNQNYSSDLAKAIKNEDEEMIATIVGIMLDEKIGGIDDSSVRNELDDLIKKGFSVLPRSVGDSITYEGEKITLTSGQAKSFKEVYSVANEALASLVGLSQYESATDEVKAKAINFIWDIYYNLAIEEVLGVDIESKAVLFAEAIDIEKLAIIIATARAIEADTDKNGKSISGTRKAKIQKYVASLKLTAAQKYMVMGYLGYSNKNGEAQVKAYINRLNLSKTEKEQLLAYSGY